MTDKIKDLKVARDARKREEYNRLVLKTWDDMEHDDKRAMLDRRAEVQIKNRERL